MNRKTMMEIRTNLNTIRYNNRSGSHDGCVRISVSNTLEHEFAKLKLVYLLKKQKKQVMTEVIFNTGGRADVVDLSGVIYEVLHTETLEMAKTKEKYYPPNFLIYYYKASDILKEDFIL